ncbi:MAG: GNAT family N-acetyltransferase [Bacillus sp. (in: firmicutes)]
MHPYTIKVVTKKEEIQKVVEFQEKIWGTKNVTPFPFLVASIHNGGVLIGAFQGKSLVAFCYGFPGMDKGNVFLVSHMMAVSSALRNSGIGNDLKMTQKEWALEQGYEKIRWTFDPLESRNAYLNIRKLGGYSKTFLPNHYGDMEDELNGGLPSDRLLLEWDLKQTIREREMIPANTECLIRLSNTTRIPLRVENNVKWDAGYYKVPVPKDIHKIKQQDFAIAKKWRLFIGYCFQTLFELGYEIVDFLQTEEPVNYYIVKKMEGEND